MSKQRVASVVEAARAYYDTGEPVTFNYRLQNQGQASIDLEVSMVMDTWPDGSERGTFVLITDITERRRAELALRKSEDRLSRFLEASAEGVIFQRAGLITDVNPAACRMLGVTDIQDLVGRPVLSVVSPDFVERARTVISSGADAFYETELIDAQGAVVPVELIGRMMEHNGERLRMTVIRDIRDRREAQARIHELIDDLRSQKDRAEAPTAPSRSSWPPPATTCASPSTPWACSSPPCAPWHRPPPSPPPIWPRSAAACSPPWTAWASS